MGTDTRRGGRFKPSTGLTPNHPAVYDGHRLDWWRSRGPFAALQWLARSRARLLPTPARVGDLLADVGCGAGLLAPYVTDYRYVGFDRSPTALGEAARRGLNVVRADVGSLPIRSRAAAVVVAGEIFEHVDDLDACLDEVVRIMAPDATLVFDTINDTTLARWLLVRVGDRLPGGPPPILHDPALFVPPQDLAARLARRGIEVEWWGLRPSLAGYAGYLAGRGGVVEMVPTRLEAVLYQGVGHRR